MTVVSAYNTSDKLWGAPNHTKCQFLHNVDLKEKFTRGQSSYTEEFGSKDGVSNISFKS